MGTRDAGQDAFVDTGSIGGGELYPQLISKAVSSANMMLALIGPSFSFTRLNEPTSVLIVGTLIYREMTWKKLFATLETTAWPTGRVLLIMFSATVFGRLPVESQIPAIIAEGRPSFSSNIYFIWS